MTYTDTGTSKGRFVTSKTNVLGETTTYDWDETRGLLNSETTTAKLLIIPTIALVNSKKRNTPTATAKRSVAMGWKSPFGGFRGLYVLQLYPDIGQCSGNNLV
jgi:YD repeat-containing protein